MKRKGILRTGLILLTTVAMLLLTVPYASAETEVWVTKASMHTPRVTFRTEVLNDQIYAIGGRGSDNKVTSKVEKYDPNKNEWSDVAPMLTPRYCFSTEVVNGCIYAIGGLKELSGDVSNYLASIEKYDPTTNTWTYETPLSLPRRDVNTVTVNGKIYVIGGLTSTNESDSVEVYNPHDNTCEKLPRMPKGMSGGCKLQVINDNIYAIQSSNSSITIEQYNTSTDKWTLKTSMPLNDDRHDPSTAVIGDSILFLGGYSTSNNITSSCLTVENYDSNTDVWSKKSSMNTQRSYFQAVKVDQTIYAIGGYSYNSGKSISSAEVYDSSNDKWTNIASMAVPRHDFQAEVVKGKIYALGGCDNSSVLSSVEAYKVQSDPTLNVTPSSDEVTLGNQFTTTVAIHNAENICAEDVKLTYDSSLFEFVSATAQDGQKLCTADNSVEGTVRLINASQGIDNAANGDKDLITLTFKAKGVGTGKIDIVKGRIADNATLEEDVAEANCGECSVTVETSKDVNRSGSVTLLDLGIDAGYYGKNASETDSSKYDADVVPDGKIDGQDLDAIDKALLENSDYEPNK